MLAKNYRVLAAVKTSAVNAAFPILLIVESPNLCFPNSWRLTKYKNSKIKILNLEKKTKNQKIPAKPYNLKRKWEKSH